MAERKTPSKGASGSKGKTTAAKSSTKTSAAKRTTAKKSSSTAKSSARSAPSRKSTTAKKPAASPKAKTTETEAKTSGEAASRAPSRPPVNLPAPESEPAAAEAEETTAAPDKQSATEKRGSDLPTAPSLGPNTVIEREPVEQRLARHEQSDVDAMGKDKRRPVVGETYGPTRARQAALYGVFLAVVAALAIGFKLLADELDQPPETNPDVAPWSQPDARQVPPEPLQ